MTVSLQRKLIIIIMKNLTTLPVTENSGGKTVVGPSDTYTIQTKRKFVYVNSYNR